MELRPLSSLRVSRHQIPAHRHGLIPNTSLQHKPLLLYHGAFLLLGDDDPAAAIEAHVASVGAVRPQWRYTMYGVDHFHTAGHEVLCVSRGRARLRFGGDGNPGGVEAVVEAGDVMVVPAGVAHRLLSEEGDRSSTAGDGGGEGEGFEMVGSYVEGCRWDMCYGRTGEEEKVRSILGLPWFTRDPIYGGSGPALDV
ncbi:RmlC-like cupin domain-containing protein [Xylariaceae sp. FL0804]|nr:RmlC-like cupin domain-containing protein [Xylariaceae sp. FL0804]